TSAASPAKWSPSVGTTSGPAHPGAQDLAERRGGEADADVEGSEERVAGAGGIEAHLVDQLLEDEGVVGKERHAPLPVVEPDGARDHLQHLAGILPPDLAMTAHQRGAILGGEVEPVHLLAAPLRHRVEAEIATRRDLREEPRRRDLLHL